MAQVPRRSERTGSPRTLAWIILPIALVAGLGSLITRSNIPIWYASLEKPTGTPPDWIFGPVWTVLYVLMAYALWRILSGAPRITQRRWAIKAFFVQLALNLCWSVVFFGLHSPFSGWLVILALLAAILVTIGLFWGLDKVSAYALIPYALWVGYATFLNAGIWWLNS